MISIICLMAFLSPLQTNFLSFLFLIKNQINFVHLLLFKLLIKSILFFTKLQESICSLSHKHTSTDYNY